MSMEKNRVNGEERVMTMIGTETTIKNLINGLISYIIKYLSPVEYQIDKFVDGNDIVIIVRVKNVADKVHVRNKK
ncbi:MAG: hypothetical protein RXO36_04700 [Candidatus Nanopusillus acidilobi]